MSKNKIPPQNGWGKINSGQRYHVITTDLDRAFCALKWRAFELRLFQYIREACWGSTRQIKKGRRTEWTAGVVCQLSMLELSEIWQVDYRNLYRALRNMIKDRILIEHSPGIVSPNKNIETINPARFEPGAIEYAKAAWPGKPCVTHDTKRVSLVTQKTPSFCVTSDVKSRDTSESPDHSAFTERNAGVPAGACPGAELNSNSQRNTEDYSKLVVENPSACARVRDEPPLTLDIQAFRILQGRNQPTTILRQVTGSIRTLLEDGYTPVEIIEAVETVARTPKRIRSLEPYLRAVADNLRLDRESPIPPAVERTNPVPQDSVKPKKKLPSIKELAEAARTMTFGDMDEVPF